MSIRITELDAINSLQDGDYVAVDNESTGTHKFKALDISANLAGNIANTYSSSASYAVGQYCLYNNNLYRCTTTISTPEAWNGAHWVQVTVGEGLYDKVDKISGKSLSANDFTNEYKTKLDSIEAGAEVNVQADWAESDSSKDDYIKNKPVNATTNISGFMSASDKQKLDNIEAGAEVNVQANWTENDSSKDDYIKNKPTIDEALNLSSHNAVRNSAITAGINQVQGNLDTEITNRQNAVSGEQLARENADNALDGRLDTVEETLPNKANIDGSYDSMTVGNAEQLVSTVRANDQTPYIFRTSGGSVDIGDREYINGIVGGTVAWNQQSYNGDFTSLDGWGELNVHYRKMVADNGWAKIIPTADVGQLQFLTNSENYGKQTFVSGHAYLMMLKAESNIIPTQAAFFAAENWVNVINNVTAVNKVGEISIITKATGNAHQYSRFGISFTGTFVADESYVRIDNFMVFDLTQMFGNTIADYIYALEQNHAGDGVAWFKKLFPKPYYAYNAGELKSVSGLVNHDMTGFNQWDEVTELGGISSSDGQNVSSGMQLRTKNYIHIIPNTAYYNKVSGWGVQVNLRTRFYDADKNYLGYQPKGQSQTGANNIFVTPDNAYFMRFEFPTEYGTTYNNDICINLSWDGSRNGEYEPYVKHSYSFDDSLTLRGIPKLDANNNLYYDGDTYESDGTVTRKYGIVDLGTLTWTKVSVHESGDYKFQANVPTIKPNASVATRADYTICSKYSNASPNETYLGTDGVSVETSVYGYVSIHDSNFNDKTADQFKTAMSGVYLVYELATPTTEEEADPYTSPQIVNDFGTEEYVISDNTFAVPVGHDTDYPINLKSKLEMAPDSPDGDGDYIVRQTNGMNSYVPLVIEDVLPTIPGTAGSYILTVTVVEGENPVLSWEANA